MIIMQITLKGSNELTANINKIKKQMADKIADFLYQEGLKIEARSTELIPVDTGFARSHKYTTPAIKQGSKLVVEVGYTKEVHYIVPLHEKTYVKHTVGQAKFLETAFVEHERMFYTNAQRFLKSVLSNIK